MMKKYEAQALAIVAKALDEAELRGAERERARVVARLVEWAVEHERAAKCCATPDLRWRANAISDAMRTFALELGGKEPA